MNVKKPAELILTLGELGSIEVTVLVLILLNVILGSIEAVFGSIELNKDLWISWQGDNLRRGLRGFNPYLQRPQGVAVDLQVLNRLVG
jgi:hypothetical protein